jgi:hypothetical protein
MNPLLILLFAVCGTTIALGSLALLTMFVTWVAATTMRSLKSSHS